MLTMSKGELRDFVNLDTVLDDLEFCKTEQENMYFDILINIITKNHIITQLCQYQNQFHDKDVANESS